MDERKAIFIAISRAGVARNLLFNQFIDLLAEKYRVVILTPLYNDPAFRAKFSRFDIEPLFERELTPFQKKLELSFISLHKALIYNPTIRLGAEQGLMLMNYVRFRRLRNLIGRYFFGIFLSWNWSRNFAKWLDGKFFPCKLYDTLIDKYKPAAVFISSIGADDQVALLRNCKKRRILSVGMAASWDNLSKYGMREMADFFVVWSDYMQEEAIKFQCYKNNQVVITGIPQFDYYVNLPIISRDEFYRKFKLDPAKRVIFFGSEGPVCPDDPHVVSFLQEKIKDGTLPNYQVLVRPHFGYKTDIERFMPLVDNITISIDNFHEVSNFRDGTGISLESVKNLTVELRYCDVAITSASTLVLDISANGKQPLLYNFDKNKNTPYKRSIHRLYTSLWFIEVMKMGLDNICDNEAELISKIKEITLNPHKDVDKRERLLQRFCYRIDGKSGFRLFRAVDDFIQKNLLLNK